MVSSKRCAFRRCDCWTSLTWWSYLLTASGGFGQVNLRQCFPYTSSDMLCRCLVEQLIHWLHDVVSYLLIMSEGLVQKVSFAAQQRTLCISEMWLSAHFYMTCWFLSILISKHSLSAAQSVKCVTVVDIWMPPCHHSGYPLFVWYRASVHVENRW